MRGSQQSSRCSAIWNVMKRSRYMWLGRRGGVTLRKCTQRINFTHETRCTFQLGHKKKGCHVSETPVAPVVTNTCSTETLKLPIQKLRRGGEKKTAYTVLLSCLISLEENSLRMSKKARLSGGPPSPWGLGSLNANSIPSLRRAERKRKDTEQRFMDINQKQFILTGQ